MKERIIEASMELFNKLGTHKVTTNHIIDRLGISPGTFYYHFKNKEEILRKVFERITLEFDALFTGDLASFSIIDYGETIRKIYQLYYKYRSFYYDISMLLDRDPELERRYRANYMFKSEKLTNLTLTLEEKGVLKKFTSDLERKAYIENLWIISDYRLSFLRATGERDPENIIESGVRSYLMYMKPYLSPKAAQELDSYLLR
ncbi:MAG: HTH-type transcriptional regulator MtrR [Spirochaetes bacterium ADurb.Bin218]|jgi:AcrR family transcriptional regulator|nr:MAG: HTH-type transcriptional regulator MtrR [Spirochaetes bacterium ADurb.Bin218]